MKLFILFFLALFISISAQVEYSNGVVPAGEYSGFYLDAINYKSDVEGKTKLDVYYQIPYSNLQFVKYNDKFRAKYSLTLTIYDEGKENILKEKTWNGKIFSNSFEEASSDNNFKFGLKSFELTPGKYHLECDLYDKDSKKDFKIESGLTVREFKNDLSFSDILLVSSEVDGKLILNISNAISSADSSLFFYYEIYSNKNDSLNIRYTIKTEDNDIVSSVVKKQNIIAGTNQIKMQLDNSQFSLGKYVLSITALDENNNGISGISKIFVSKIYGFPSSITDLDLAAEQMVYITSEDVIDDIVGTKDPDEKLQKFKDFWKKKDPTPQTPHNEVLNEYYRRVAYANKHFKKYYDGWKTDMGMIYIMLGPPQNVDRHPFELDSKPYEVWYYYNINQAFYFVDETGFGDYRLMNTNFGDWYRYRQ